MIQCPHLELNNITSLIEQDTALSNQTKAKD